MKRALTPISIAAILIFTAQHSPAPITEESTPVPKPKAAAPRPARPKPTELKPKPAAMPRHSFPGTWSGNATSRDNFGNTYVISYQIRISDDEKAVLVNVAQSGQAMSGPPSQGSSTRFGDALSWSFSNNGGTTTYTMRINSDGTADFHREGSYTTDDGDVVTYSQSGTLAREGASQTVPQTGPSSTAPQSQTATTKDGLPIAKAVPDKPGFVYNPYDPNSRILLDVRGRASGTKLIEPKSGKMFVVP